MLDEGQAFSERFVFGVRAPIWRVIANHHLDLGGIL